MRKNVVVVILISMLIISACSFSNAKETKQNLVEACSETPSEADVSIDQSLEDSFMAQMPIHSGIWQVADYGQTEYYYEFSKDYTGRRVNALGVVIEEFSYELKRKDK